ncbi:N-acetyltransferase [Sporanaerobium hydrogeniformans]|uniref:N-acetyltransferase n=1 Tax=Sporanaerobium hydrogeniformans TaxID=3072179 RepID=A0AC61DAZ6_9FIRM|nr:N-acetyltransferase [Sporanaerobium hydrogeniformans]PHV70410.1 N-acetyltransferase [Sporanaerobium hydrogeniformans]
MIRGMRNTEEEVRAIMSIWEEANMKAHSFIPKVYWKRNYSLVKETYLPLAVTYVYEEEGKIKGFVSILAKKYIGALFVANECQNQGIGKKLLNYVAKEHGPLTLSVFKKNERALKFYLNNGCQLGELDINEDTLEEEYTLYLS